MPKDTTRYYIEYIGQYLDFYTDYYTPIKANNGDIDKLYKHNCIDELYLQEKTSRGEIIVKYKGNNLCEIRCKKLNNNHDDYKARVGSHYYIKDMNSLELIHMIKRQESSDRHLYDLKINDNIYSIMYHYKWDMSIDNHGGDYVNKDLLDFLEHWLEAVLAYFDKPEYKNINKRRYKLPYLTNKQKEEYISNIESKQVEGYDKEALVNVRVNQGIFRDDLLKRYGECAICGIKNKDVLIASHIKPWKDSNSIEKCDVNNGILLCANHDRLFDKGYISFEDDGVIIISQEFDDTSKWMLRINNSDCIDLLDDNLKYLKYHREKVFRG